MSEITGITNDDLSSRPKTLAALQGLQKEIRQMGSEAASENAALMADFKRVTKKLTEREAFDHTAGMTGDEDHARHFVFRDAPKDEGGTGEDRIRLFNIKHDDGYVERGLLSGLPKTAWEMKAQELIESRSMVHMARGQKRRFNGKLTSPLIDSQIRRHMRYAPRAVRDVMTREIERLMDPKRILTDAATQGQEWIPNLHLPLLEREVDLPRNVAALFANVNMQTRDSTVNVLDGRLTPRLKSPGLNDNPANFTPSSLVTSNRSVSIPGMVARTVFDEDTSEDTIMNSVQILRFEIGSCITDGWEDALLNADTAGSPGDDYDNWDIRGRWGVDTIGGAGDHRKGIIGLRARAVDVSNTTDQTSAQTSQGALIALSKLAAPRGIGQDTVFIMSPEYAVKVMSFTETLTVDKFGPRASIVAGHIANLFGVPIIISDFMSNDMNASGLYDNATMTKTGFLTVNRTRHQIWNLQSLRVRMQPDINNGTVSLVADVRQDFYPRGRALEKNVHFSYNLDALA